MKKWKFSKNKKKKSSLSQEKGTQDNNNKGPKQIGTYNDFLVFDNYDKYKDNKLEFQKCEIDDPSLNDWLILKNSPNRTESRFSRFFEEITENDKKPLIDEKKIIKDSNKKDEKNENNINEINDNININRITIDKNNINFNNIDTDNMNNNNNNNNNSINNMNNNIQIGNNIINNDNIDIYNKKINNNNNADSRNNSESLTTAGTFKSNFFSDRKLSEISLLNSSNNGNIPLMIPNVNDQNSPQEDKKITYNNFTGPQEQKYNIYVSSSGIIANTVKDPDLKSIKLDKLDKSDKSDTLDQDSSIEPRPSKKKFRLNVDIKMILSLEDRRTTVMIKNIPIKFKRETLLNLIHPNFKSAYDIFILPTDVIRYKNFGYCFINFTSTYYIPYFYFLFNGKKWSSSNSLKICEITYSKIQGKNNLLSHYPKKNVYRNDEAIKFNTEQKYIIPNEYRNIFDSIFPNQLVEEYEGHFITKIPFK